jgi:hypothetical protein
LSMQLQASNQSVIQGSGTATLSAGTQPIAVTFPNAAILSLGVNGPYERTNATLTQTDTLGNTFVADFRIRAAPLFNSAPSGGRKPRGTAAVELARSSTSNRRAGIFGMNAGFRVTLRGLRSTPAQASRSGSFANASGRQTGHQTGR